MMNYFCLKNPNLVRHECLIGDVWQVATDGASIEVVNPFDNQLLGVVPNLSDEQILAAIDTAHTAQLAWAEMTAKARAEILFAWARLIDDNKDDLGKILSLEQGKPLAEAVGEIAYANSFIRYYAELARQISGDVLTANHANTRHLVIKQPIGVCAAITPWNFPSAMITRKAAPALASGCTMLVKPDSQTPFSALALAYLGQLAGLPAGVLTILTGDADRIGKFFCTHAKIAKLSFTGSTSVGRLLMQQSAESLKKLSLELGGNAPFIVFDDANLELAVKALMAGKFRNAGQTCIAPNRIFVQSKVFAKFCERLVDEVGTLTVGNGLDADTKMGVLINQKAVEKAQTLVWQAVAEGAKVLVGGTVAKEISPNAFLPTVITNLTPAMKLACNELFSPIVALYSFDDEEEVIRLANDTEYGLAAYFFCQDYGRAWRVAEQLHFGMVGHNTTTISHDVAPFGGVKQSGFGREGSTYGLEEYLTVKSWTIGV